MEILVVYVAHKDEDRLIEAISESGVRTVVMPCRKAPDPTSAEDGLNAAEILYRSQMGGLAPEERVPTRWDDLSDEDRNRFCIDHTVETKCGKGGCQRPAITAMTAAEMESFLSSEPGTAG